MNPQEEPYAERLTAFIDAFFSCTRCRAGIEQHVVSADAADRPRAWCLAERTPGPSDPEYKAEMKAIVRGFGDKCNQCGEPLQEHALVPSVPSGTPDIWCQE